MILYHHTAEEHLDQILREGLTKGDVPTSQTEGVNGVWFTTSASPEGHGLLGGRLMSDDEREFYRRLRGFLPPPGARYPNKKAVRITVMIPSTDRRLVPWSKWGRKHCEPQFFKALNECGPMHKSWFIYFGAIDPSRFTSVHVSGKRFEMRFATALESVFSGREFGAVQ